MVQFRDGPFIRPHPAFWRIVLGSKLSPAFSDSANIPVLIRTMMTYIDPNLGVPLPEKSYAEDCALTASNLWVSIFPFNMTAPHLPPSYP
ncbi:PSS domain-containing protein [Rhizoctonia solani AG-1 IA]|uniref:PSS domain-containing protein n=1 Tax=Thanatephorus cucumeris (strain AG1-IA) TaxID=983506 RepID=L8WC29_THACA|nr:PSS domain-containing protein [Rhizoctonia solani AG-1 IA]